MSVAAAVLSRHAEAVSSGMVRCREEGRRIIVSLSGSLDLERSQLLQSFLVDLVQNVGKPYVVEIDFANVTYISSTGVGAMVSVLVTAKRQELELKIYGFQPKILEVFKLLGLLAFFEESGSGGGSG